ncbi:MAG: hypothetical protein AB1938_07655 [Myxococcota bacterium]
MPPVLSVPGVVFHHAGGVLQAAALMASAHPRLVLMRPERAWHRRFLLTLPASVRPAVVAVGTKAPPELADGWLDPRLSPEDAALALEYAEHRAELRRLRATVAPARPEFAEALGAA